MMLSTRASLALVATLGAFVPNAHAAVSPAGDDITYDVGGETFEGYLSSAEGEAKGTVLIVHDWAGLTDYERRRADMLAELGFDAFAVDLYGQGNRPDAAEDRKAETARLYEDRQRMRELTLAGLAEARAQGAAEPTVVMGYCFGGAVVLELARSEEADEVVGYASFHGGLATPDGQEWPDEVGPILIAHGGADDSIPMSQVATLSEELEAADVTYEIEVYSGAPHGFTVFGNDSYQERADEKSWSAFLDLLDEAL